MSIVCFLPSVRFATLLGTLVVSCGSSDEVYSPQRWEPRGEGLCFYYAPNTTIRTSPGHGLC